MKARIENGAIKMYGQLPQDHDGFLNFPMAGEDIHRACGFFDVVQPEFDPDYHRLGGIYFDQENQVFTYPLIEIPIEQVKQKLLQEFDSAKRKIRTELIETIIDRLIEINRDNLPEGLISLYESLLSENSRVVNDIDYLSVYDPDRLRKYRIVQEDINSILQNIKQFKS